MSYANKICIYDFICSDGFDGVCRAASGRSARLTGEELEPGLWPLGL